MHTFKMTPTLGQLIKHSELITIKQINKPPLPMVQVDQELHIHHSQALGLMLPRLQRLLQGAAPPDYHVAVDMIVAAIREVTDAYAYIARGPKA